jgi:hypothetical protein
VTSRDEKHREVERTLMAQVEEAKKTYEQEHEKLTQALKVQLYACV